jgi:hypothetical protein
VTAKKDWRARWHYGPKDQNSPAYGNAALCGSRQRAMTRKLGLVNCQRCLNVAAGNRQGRARRKP